MKKALYLLLVVSLILSACQSTQEQNEEPSIEEMMADMPCHQMPDGTWMGRCDEKTTDNAQEEVIEVAKTSSVVSPTNSFKLDARPVSFTLNDVEVSGYGYNGEIPGPFLQVEKDQEVTVEFTNNLPEETTVHWHGLRHDIKDDGVPGVSQPPVLPGESYTYKLFFPDEGLFWYHPHIREDRQQDLGLSGLMRVGSSPYPEEYIVLDDLLFERNFNFNYGADHANFALMGRFGNNLLINGKESFETTMQTGEIKRFFFANVANVRPFRISFVDANMKVVGGDIGWIEQEKIVDEVIIGPAERVAIDVQYLEPGTYNIIHESSEELQYVVGTIVVTQGDTVEDFSVQTHEDIKADIDSFRPYFDKEPDYTLTLNIDMGFMNNMPCHQMGGVWMGDCTDEQFAQNSQVHNDEDEHHGIEWEDEMKMMNLMSNTENIEWQFIDQDGNVNTDILMGAKVGDKIKVRLINKEDSAHPMQHPIHLHGQRFLITSVNGKVPDTMGWEDTILVPAGTTADILIDVTNPGEWMVHCHIAEHLEAGMMTSFIVE